MNRFAKVTNRDVKAVSLLSVLTVSEKTANTDVQGVLSV